MARPNPAFGGIHPLRHGFARLAGVAFSCLFAAGSAVAGELVVANGAAYALEVAGGPPPAAWRTPAFDYRLQVGDILIGRTAPLNINVRIRLEGAEWDGVPPVAVGTSQGAGGATLVGTPLVSGSLLVFVVQPPTSLAGGFLPYAGPGDELFRIGPNARIRNATALQSAGAPGVRASVEIRDIRTGQLLQTGDPVSLLRSESGVSVSFTAGGTFTADIAAEPVLSRFVNLPVNAGFIASDLVQLGSVRVQASGTAEGSLLTSNVDGGTGAFVFDTNPANGADEIAIAVTLPNASAVAANGVYLAGSASCGPPFAVLERNGDLFAGRVRIPAGGETTYTWPICLRTTGAAEIARQTISATASVDLFDSRATDSAQVQSRALANVRSNGSEATVSFFNPRGNGGQESMLRIVNESDRGGLVRISGTCDSGDPSTTSVAFTLAASRAVQLSATELEDGSAKTESTRLTFGPGCTGKRRLLITANFTPMAVVNLIRNQGTGGTVLTEIRGTP
jgi:hypothetical protein